MPRPRRKMRWLHGIYEWTMAQAAAPYALWMLALIAFVESSVFPIPPDVLLIPMVLAMRDRAWLIAGVCTIASVASGFLGYAIGALLFETLGRPILEFYGYVEQFAEFRVRYSEWGGRRDEFRGPRGRFYFILTKSNETRSNPPPATPEPAVLSMVSWPK